MSQGIYSQSSINIDGNILKGLGPEYIVKDVAEFDAALANILSTGIGGSICLKKGTYDKGSPFIVPSVSNIRIFSEGGAIIVPPAADNAMILGSDATTYVYNLRIENIKFEGGSTSEPIIKTFIQTGWADYKLADLFLDKIVVSINVVTVAAFKLINQETHITNGYFYCGAAYAMEQQLAFIFDESNNVYWQPAISIPLGSYQLLIQSENNKIINYTSFSPYLLRATVGQRFAKFNGNSYGFSNGNTTPYIIDANDTIDNFVDGCQISNNSIYHTGGTTGVVEAINILHNPGAYKFVEFNYQLNA